jgi:hypothetical protein
MSVYCMPERVFSRGWIQALEAIFATARSVSEIQPDSRYGLNLVRWLPGIVCSEGEYES